MNDPTANPRRIYEGVALKLTEKIKSGEFPAGSLLPSERVLAEMFEASRPAVRDALLWLQSSGLISVRPRSRARVTLFNSTTFFDQLSGSAQMLLTSPSGVSDLMEVRSILECGLARHAARYASPREIEKLATALEANRMAMPDSDLFMETDLAFHSALAEIPRNPIIMSCNSSLSEWMKVQRPVHIRVQKWIKTAYQGHEAIYKAIAARNIEQADQAMADHLASVSELLRQTQAAKPRKAE